MAIDDLLDRARDAKRRRDEAASELTALVKALDGLDGVRRRELARLRERPRARRAGRRRNLTSVAGGAAGA